MARHVVLAGAALLGLLLWQLMKSRPDLAGGDDKRFFSAVTYAAGLCFLIAGLYQWHLIFERGTARGPMASLGGHGAQMLYLAIGGGLIALSLLLPMVTFVINVAGHTRIARNLKPTPARSLFPKPIMPPGLAPSGSMATSISRAGPRPARRVTWRPTRPARSQSGWQASTSLLRAKRSE